MKISCEKGLTLVEVIAATALLSLIAFILSGIFTKNIERNYKDDHHLSAINIAQDQMQVIKKYAQDQPRLEWGNIPNKKLPIIESLPDSYSIRVQTEFVPSGTQDVLKIIVETTAPHDQVYTLVGYIGRGRTQ